MSSTSRVIVTHPRSGSSAYIDRARSRKLALKPVQRRGPLIKGRLLRYYEVDRLEGERLDVVAGMVEIGTGCAPHRQGEDRLDQLEGLPPPEQVVHDPSFSCASRHLPVPTNRDRSTGIVPQARSSQGHSRLWQEAC
jgi:hypothetical protein